MSDGKSGLLLKEGILVTALPALAYLCSYLYELGFARYFRIPADFISVDVVVLLNSVIGIFVIGCIGIAVVSLTTLRFKSADNPVLLVLGRFWPLLIVLGFIHLEVQVTNWRWIVATTGCILWILLEWLAPLFEGRKGEKYRQRFARRQNELQDRRGFLGERLGVPEHALVVLSFSLFLLLAASYEWGMQEAQRKSRFIVVDDPPNTIALGIYGKKVVLGRYDSKTKELGSGRTIVFLDGKQEFRLDFQEIENLTVSRPEGGTFWEEWR